MSDTYTYSYSVQVDGVEHTNFSAMGQQWPEARDAALAAARGEVRAYGDDAEVTVVMSKSHIMWSNKKRPK